jgi:7,8-dihydropterin-6-yl-methyl-4-(beta-D-ribofuranosyl)aminobenzene 5'-phosphate synthase
MKVTALVENTRLESRQDLSAEWGLSLHIQHDGRQILFDTGATEAYGHNAERLGVDIREVNMLVISHHHYDHGGGLAHFLETNSKAKVYLRRNEAGDPYYRALFGIINRYVGLDKGLLRKHADRFEVVDEFAEIWPDVFILIEIGNQYPLPRGNRHLFVEEGGTRRLDRFEHELVMVVREKEGLVVLTGCSHRGILNMVDAVSRQFRGVPIKAVFGGFHLIGGLPKLNTMAGSKREVEGIGEEMLKYPIEKVYTGHCTGPKAYRVLKGVMGDKLEYLPTGGGVEF